MNSSESSQWKRESGYILSMLGSAVGFANVISFSAQCYRNGGGAFLIPFTLALLILGLPMLFLEGIIGKRFGLPLATAYGKMVGSWGKFFGWIAVLCCLTIGAFYTVLTGYAVAYTWFSAVGELPANSAAFFKDEFLQTSSSLMEWGGFSWPILVSSLGVLAFSCFVLVRRIQSGIESLCTIFLPLLTALVLFFAIVTAFLPGATLGMYHYLYPDFSRLKDPFLWRDVFGQLFFSLSLGLGIVTGYARHAKGSISIPRAMVWVAIGDFLVSFVAGFAIFCCIGYMATQSGQDFGSLVQTDSAFELGFVVFPDILQTFGPSWSRVLGVVFFFSVFIAGVTGVFSIIEAVVGNVQVEFKKSRKFAVLFVSGILIFLILPFCAGNSPYIVDALTPIVMGYNMLIGGIMEILVFLFLSKAIRNDSIWTHNWLGRVNLKLLTWLGLPILGTILIAALATEVESGFGTGEIVRVIWLLLACGASWILAHKGVKANELPEEN